MLLGARSVLAVATNLVNNGNADPEARLGVLLTAAQRAQLAGLPAVQRRVGAEELARVLGVHLEHRKVQDRTGGGRTTTVIYECVWPRPGDEGGKVRRGHRTHSLLLTGWRRGGCTQPRQGADPWHDRDWSLALDNRMRPWISCLRVAAPRPFSAPPANTQAPIVVHDLDREWAVVRACIHLIAAAYAEDEVDVWGAPAMTAAQAALVARGRVAERGEVTSVMGKMQGAQLAKRARRDE